MKAFLKAALMLAVMSSSVAVYAYENPLVSPGGGPGSTGYVWDVTAKWTETYHDYNNIIELRNFWKEMNAKNCQQGLYQGKSASEIKNSICYDNLKIISRNEYRIDKTAWRADKARR